MNHKKMKKLRKAKYFALSCRLRTLTHNLRIIYDSQKLHGHILIQRTQNWKHRWCVGGIITVYMISLFA